MHPFVFISSHSIKLAFQKGREEFEALFKIRDENEAITTVNKALDTLYESFDRSVKDVKIIADDTEKWLFELSESLLEENERKYNKLCDEVLGIEEKIKEEGNTGEFIERLRSIPGELCFTSFDDDFCSWAFNKLLIVS